MMNGVKTLILLGKCESASLALDRFESYRSLLRLSPEEAARSILIHPSNAQPEHLQAVTCGYGGVLLGAPIGSPQYIEAWLAKKLSFYQEEHSRVLSSNLGSPKQWMLFHLSLCNQVNHTLRMLPPLFTSGFVESCQAMLVRTFQDITRCGPLSPDQQAQLYLPIAEGGFGLPNFTLTAPVAFVSSCAAASVDILQRCPRLFDETQAFSWIKELGKAAEYVQSFLKPEERASFSDFMQNSATLQQSSLSSAIYLATSAKYHGLPRRDPVVAARLLSLRSSDAGAWLLARCSKENQMTDVQFHTAICLRLGAILPGLTDASKCSECKSHPLVDPRGEHFLHCPCGGE